MTIEQIHDVGQKLYMTGKVVGVVDSPAICLEVATAIEADGFSKVEIISGEEGLRLLERVDSIFFGDMEGPILKQHIQELRDGHAVIAIESPSDRVDEAVRVAAEHGARSLIHFGPLAVTWLTK